MKFSIIIPTLNEEAFLPKLLASLAAQTYKDFEVIVVDGKSKDKTANLAHAAEKTLPHLTVLESVGPGIPKQRNAGARRATGEWLIFADADGEFFPAFLERLDRFIEQEKPELLTTWFSPDSHIANDAITTLFINMIVESSILFKRPFAPGTLTIVSRKVFDRVGGYDERLAFGEDYDFGARLHKTGVHLSILRETLCVYSLRRFRNEGKLKLFQQYARSALSVVLMNRSPKSMAGYIMGGEPYKKGKAPERSAFKKFQTELKKIVKELME